MYVAHFYAGTHKENIRNKISTALNAGVPVFISECSICDASGNGGIDYASANEWLDFMNSNQLSLLHGVLAIKQKLQHLFHQAAVLRAAGVMVICLRREDGLRVRYREGSLNMLLISAI